MALIFYGHPFSSYCQKALIALYENDIPFEWRVLSPDNPQAGADMAAMWDNADEMKVKMKVVCTVQ